MMPPNSESFASLKASDISSARSCHSNDQDTYNDLELEKCRVYLLPSKHLQIMLANSQ